MLAFLAGFVRGTVVTVRRFLPRPPLRAALTFYAESLHSIWWRY